MEYTHFFSNNDKHITNNNALGIVNDIFYLVYLEGVEGIANVYSGIHFILSSDIQCIDKTGI